MRVLLTTDTIGGVWTFTRELTTQLLASGHAVALISFGRAPSAAQLAWSKAMLARYHHRFRYDASSTPLEWMEANSLSYKAGLPLLLRVAGDFAPDLIHSSQFCFGALPLSTPVVITAHSDALSWADACRPSGLAPSPWLDQYISLVQRGLNAAAAVVAPTHWMLNALEQHFSFKAPAHVILNGRSLPAPLPTNKLPQAVSVGRMWDEAKNLELLTGLTTAMPIFIAGEQRFEAVQGPTRTSHLRMLGVLDEPELLQLLRESSIYIVPSLHEPFGLAPLEAAQCGCAILAHDIPSLREVWGHAALYFKDAPSLDSLLQALISNPHQLLEARSHAAHRARQLTGARMAQNYLTLYGALLASNEPAPNRTRERVREPGQEELASYA